MILGGSSLRWPLRTRAHSTGAGLGDSGQHVLFELHVIAHGAHEVGDEIVPALQLHTDLRPRFIHAQATANQSVVERNQEPGEYNNDSQDNQQGQRGARRGLLGNQAIR